LTTVDAVQKDIDSQQLPETDKEFYADTYKAISSSSAGWAAEAISVLFCAQKKLSIRAFLDVPWSAGVPTAKQLISSCKGFIVVDQKSDSVRFFHPSFEQYLQENTGYEDNAHALTAALCLRKLSTTLKVQIWERGRSRSRETSLGRQDQMTSLGSQDQEISFGRQDQETSLGSQDQETSFGRQDFSPRLRSRSNSSSRPRSQLGSDKDATSKDATPKKPKTIVTPRQVYTGPDEPIQDFYEYSSLFWATHCSKSSDCIVDGLSNMLLYPVLSDRNHPFPRWIASVQKLFSQRPLGFYDMSVERELEMCISDSPSPYLTSCIYGLTEIVARYNQPLSDTSSSGRSDASDDSEDALEEPAKAGPAFAETQGLSDIHLICMFGRLDTLKRLEGLTSSSKRDDSTFYKPDRNEKTPLQHAVESAKNPDMVQALLETKAKKSRTHVNVLMAAMRNKYCAKELVDALLFRNGERRRIKNPTKELLIAALQYPYADLELVKSCDPKSHRSGPHEELILEAAVSWRKTASVPWDTRKDIWDYLLDDKGLYSQFITSFELAIEAGDLDLVIFLLRRKRNEKVRVWRRHFQMAASRENHPWELLKAFLEGKNDAQEDLHKALPYLLSNPVANSEMITKLCERMTQVTINLEDLFPIAASRERGTEVMRSLLKFNLKVKYFSHTPERYTPGDIVRVAISNRNPEVLKLLVTSNVIPIDQFSDTEFFSIVAVGSREHSLNDIQRKYVTIVHTYDPLDEKAPVEYWDMVMQESISLLLEHNLAKDGYITQDLVERAVLIRGRRVIELLFQRRDPDATSSIRGRWGIKSLLQQGKLQITSKMIIGAVKNPTYGHNLLEFLFNRASDLRLLDNHLVWRTAAECGTLQTMQFLLRNPQKEYKPDFCLAAARNPDPDVVEFIFRKIDAIEFACLEIGARNSDRALEYLLTQWEKTTSISSAQRIIEPVLWESLACIVAEHCRWTSTLDQVLSHLVLEDCAKTKVEEILLSAVRNWHSLEMLRYLFRRCGEGGVIREVNTAMMEAAASNSALAPEMLRVLFNECNDELLLKVITEEVLVKAVNNKVEGPEALKMLLMEDGVAAMVSERVLVLASHTKTMAVLQHYGFKVTDRSDQMNEFYDSMS
jgi:hypothetical protein